MAAEMNLADHQQFLEHAHQVASLCLTARGRRDRSYWCGVLRMAAAELDRGSQGERKRICRPKIQQTVDPERLRVCRVTPTRE